MTRTMLAGKIHRATVTEANVDYEGSITIDPNLLEASGILPYEMVQVLDLTNGARVETYAIEGERGSGEVCVNGAAGLLIHEGDLVIVLHFVQVGDEEASHIKPKIVGVDARNHIAFKGSPLQTDAER
jgi:aspartate 1-decarboxylase